MALASAPKDGKVVVGNRRSSNLRSGCGPRRLERRSTLVFGVSQVPSKGFRLRAQGATLGFGGRVR